MSMPSFSQGPEISRDEAVTLILASIGMGELGLSHILNAEGEKLQHVLGTGEGELPTPATISEILEVNESVRQTLGEAMRLELMLGTKMEKAIAVPTMQGPEGPKGEQGDQGEQGEPGPQGPVGAILGSYNTLEELQNAHSTGNLGDSYLVGGDLYTWSEDPPEWKKVGNLSGPPGPSYTIIPFASGEAEYITSSSSGGKSGVVSLGFGQRYQIALQLEEYIDLPVATALAQQQLAFSLPCEGKIRGISAFFNVTTSAILDNIVIAELYYTNSLPPTNRFYPVPGGRIEFSVPGSVPVGTVYEGVAQDIDVLIPARTRLLLVFYNTTPAGITSTLTGFMSGGVQIEVV